MFTYLSVVRVWLSDIGAIICLLETASEALISLDAARQAIFIVSQAGTVKWEINKFNLPKLVSRLIYTQGTPIRCSF